MYRGLGKEAPVAGVLFQQQRAEESPQLTYCVSQLTLAFSPCFNGVKYQAHIEIKFPVIGEMNPPLIRIRTMKQRSFISLLIAHCSFRHQPATLGRRKALPF